MWSKALILIILVYLARGLENDIDSEVEFSFPESFKSLENAENASTLITQEIETHVLHQSDPPQESLTDVKADNDSANATAEAKNKIKVECAPRVIPEDEVPKVVMANSSTLLKILTPPTANNASTNECVVVLFFSPQCVFSARMAPHYNALARVYPDIAFYAVNAMEYGNLHVRYGLVFVPNVMLFHNTKPVARFNETTMTLDTFVKFINKFTVILDFFGMLGAIFKSLVSPEFTDMPADAGEYGKISAVSKILQVKVPYCSCKEKNETITKILEQILAKTDFIIEKVQSLPEKINTMASPTDVKEDEIAIIMKRFPLRNLNELEDLEAFLREDDDNYKTLVRALKAIGGHPVASLVVNILKRVFANELAEMFSWAGAKKKMPFKLLLFSKVIHEIARFRFPEVTEDEVANLIANWLRHAKQRRERAEGAASKNENSLN